MDSLPRRTMRRGTHSCLECRQRKVRCVSEPHARKCNGCSLKELPCTDQELHRPRSPNSGERKSTEERFQRLEGMLNQVLRNQSKINAGSKSPEPGRSERKSIEPFGRFHLAEEGVSATNVGERVSRKRRKVKVVDSINPDTHIRKTRDIGDEPFLKAFEEIDNRDTQDCTRPSDIRDGQAGSSSVTNEPALRILRGLRLQIPDSRELISILQAGRSTMNIWSEAFPDALGSSQGVSPERIRDHIYRCLYSDGVADGVKLMLCLALHIQQLPSDLETTQRNLPKQLDDLQEHCMTSAESLLASDERLGGTLNGLECMILQSEFYINGGNLHKVWLIVRRAINLAQLMGLHRKIDPDVEMRLVRRRNAIWTELWQRERGFSLILGLPSSTLDSQIPPSTPNNDGSDLHKMKHFLQDLGIVMGHIIDRDQDPGRKTYSATLNIEEQLEECQSIMPAQWWDFTPDPTTPTDAIRGMFAAKMRFFTVQRLLHLPFLLKASNDRRFEGSRLSTLKSSREIIKVYNVLRDEKRPVLKVCDMVDFQVFAAAMTLVIDLLALSRTPDRCDLHREEGDWQLVLQTAGILGRFSRSNKGCRVAALGAWVLDDFSQLRHGSAEGILKVDIPYFGRVEISRRRDTRQDEHISHTQSSSQINNQAQNQQGPIGAFEDSIESIISPESYFAPWPAASQPLEMVDESWTHMLDLSMADDWSWYPGGDVH